MSRIVDWFGGVSGVSGPIPGLVVECYPNPATSYAMIALAQKHGHGMVEIYDVLGRFVREDPISGGEAFTWDLTDASGRRVSPGVYFLSVSTGSLMSRKKIVLAR
jgi:flagellar hook assembly protein FlgD